MLKENQEVLIKWNPYTQKYYQEKGYVFTKRGEEFLVKIEDLLKGSHAKVKVICDFCGKEYSKVYKDYFAQHDGGDCCVECEGKKSFKKVIENHGENFHYKNLKDALEKYGVKNATEIPGVKEKIKETNLKKYGATTVLVLEENRSKMLDGIRNPSTMEKRIKTNIERYGCKYGLSSPQVREKIMKSYYNNETIPTSRPQMELCELLKSFYGECELNFPCGKYSLDCFVKIGDVKIDVEYDGAYWHQDKEEHDKKRDNYVISKGIKVYRIIGSHNIPSKEEIRKNINILLTTSIDFIKTKMV